MQIKITSAKIKSRLFLSYAYSAKENGIDNKISTSSDAPIHEDLQSAFDVLVPHLILITEESEITDKLRDLIDRESGQDFILPENFEKYKVTGITIAGAEDSESVVISGYKELKTGNYVKLNTPAQKFDDENYEFANDLYNAIEHLKSEVVEYMDGKRASKMIVGKFDFDQEDDEDFKLPENNLENLAETLQNNMPEGVTVEVTGSRVFDEDIQDPDYEDVTAKDYKYLLTIKRRDSFSPFYFN